MVNAKCKRCTASAEFIQSLLVLLSAITESIAVQMPLDCFGTNARQDSLPILTINEPIVVEPILEALTHKHKVPASEISVTSGYSNSAHTTVWSDAPSALKRESGD